MNEVIVGNVWKGNHRRLYALLAVGVLTGAAAVIAYGKYGRSRGDTLGARSMDLAPETGNVMQGDPADHVKEVPGPSLAPIAA